MNRRYGVLTVRERRWTWHLIAVALVQVSVLASSPPIHAVGRPNIVVIVTDDQRADTLSWMPIVHRRLVQKGTTFLNATIPTTTCCPSRASILTGLYAHGTGVWSNTPEPALGGWVAFNANGMEERTVATWLDPSYRTILIGKYLNHYDYASPGYVPPSWDSWHAFAEPNGLYYGYDLVHTSGSTSWFDHGARDYSTDVLRDYAVEEIQQTPAEERLFLYFAPFAPHGPSLPAPRHDGLDPMLPPYRPLSFNEPNRGDKPPWILELPRVDPVAVEMRRSLQYRSLRAVDEAVGAILDALQREGRLHNTLIIFVSDNGGSWAEHRIPLADKYMPYDAASRVPLAIRWDAVVPAEESNRRLVLNVDLAATIAQAARITPPQIDGLSLLDRWKRRGVVVEAGRNEGKQGNGLSVTRPAYCGFRTRMHLFVHYASGDEELYAYKEDPWELHNVVTRPRYQDVATRMRNRAIRGCAPTPPGFSW